MHWLRRGLERKLDKGEERLGIGCIFDARVCNIMRNLK